MLALAALALACTELVDPPVGLSVRLELVVPDSIGLGTDVTAALHVFDDAGHRLTGLPVTWYFLPVGDDPAAFSVDTLAEPGALKLRGIRAGSAELSAEISGQVVGGTQDTKKVIWSIAHGIRMDLADDDEELLVRYGQDTTLSVHALTAGGEAVPDGASIAWRIEGNQSEILSWRTEGLSALALRGNAVGSVTVIAGSPNCVGVCEDTVTVRVIQIPARLEAVPVQPLPSFGYELELPSKVTDTEGYPIYGAPVQWALADPADSLILTVEAAVATARGNGSAVVVARIGELADSMNVEVRQRIARLVVSPDQWELPPGSRDTLAVEAYDAGGSPLMHPFSVSAFSTRPDVVEVTSLGEQVEIVGGVTGSSTVSVTGESGYDAAYVVVNTPLDSLTVGLEQDTLRYITDATTARAWGLVSGDSVGVQPLFTVSDTAIATANHEGQVVARRGGTTWVRATAGGKADSALITVSQTLAWLALDPSAPSVVLHGSIPFKPLGFDSAAHAIPSFDVTFESDDPAVLSVDPDGTAVGQNLGQATITAYAGTFEASASASVIPAVLAATLGSQHGCFIVEGGALYCFGDNAAGQLGDGTTENRPAPVRAARSLRFRQVAAGSFFTCGIAVDDATYCWGAGDHGRLGNGGTSGSLAPVAVTGDPGFAQLSAGADYACGLTGEGAAYCWGANGYGQVGNGSTDDVSVPTPVSGHHRFRTLAAGPYGPCALTEAGEAYCWGVLDGGTRVATVYQPVRISSTFSFRDISGRGCAIAAADGSLHCRNLFEFSAVQDGRAYRDITSGSNFHCGEGEDDAVYCFGENGAGQLGTGDREARAQPTPAEIGDPTDFLVGGWVAACAGTTAGGLTCWGGLSNGYEWFLDQPLPRPLVYR